MVLLLVLPCSPSDSGINQDIYVINIWFHSHSWLKPKNTKGPELPAPDLLVASVTYYALFLLYITSPTAAIPKIKNSTYKIPFVSSPVFGDFVSVTGADDAPETCTDGLEGSMPGVSFGAGVSSLFSKLSPNAIM